MMKVGVVMGGVSSEREVSLLTGKEMMAHLDPGRYEVRAIEISHKRDLIEKAAEIDMALLALHGSYGEDGTVQGTLETMGIPYTGSGVLASSICMDKDVSKRLIRSEELPTPDWVTVSGLADLEGADVQRLGFPIVVKPNRGGSSIGIRIVHSADDLTSAVKEALEWDRTIMLERYIDGQEITCSILNGELLPVLSIKPHADFFDYKSKYEEGEAEETVAVLPAPVREQVEAAALQCYHALKCSVYARVDMMLKDDNLYILEVNTLPGLTKNSLLPKSAAAAGISFSRLLDIIIESSLRERLGEEGKGPWI